jgi:hypothetical protein
VFDEQIDFGQLFAANLFGIDKPYIKRGVEV